MMPNLLQYPVALFGVLRAGLVVVNVNPQYTVPELEHQLKDSGAAAIVVLENFAHTLQEVLEKNPTLNLAVITTEVGDMFPRGQGAGHQRGGEVREAHGARLEDCRRDRIQRRGCAPAGGRSWRTCR